jgi:hypothetical protein
VRETTRPQGQSRCSFRHRVHGRATSRPAQPKITVASPAKTTFSDYCIRVTCELLVGVSKLCYLACLE